MNQNTYDMNLSENEENLNINSLGDKKIQRYHPSKQGKENQNSLSYKLREIKENQNKLQMNNNINDINNSNMTSINNSNAKIMQNSQLTNQSKYSKYSKYNNISNSKMSNLNMLNYNDNPNNIMGNNSTISNVSNSNRKNTSKKKDSSSTAQIDEQYEMQKLLELENRNRIKENAYKKMKEKDINNINLKNNIPISNNFYNKKGGYNNFNINYNESNDNININSNNNIDKNLKNYIDEQAEKIKEFVHEEINNLHVDLIRQFEIQNLQNMKMMQEFAVLNSQMCKEIEKLKKENQILKEKIHN